MMKRKQNSLPSNDSSKKVKQGRRGRAEYMSDNKLLSRVRQHVSSTSGPILVSSIAETLQKQYAEYARKKKNAFQKCVEKAYSILQAHSGASQRKRGIDEIEDDYLSKKSENKNGSSSGSDEDSFSSDNEEYVPYEDSNSINNFMSDLYRNSPRSGASSNKGDNSRPASPVSGEVAKKTGVEHSSSPQVAINTPDNRKTSVQTKKISKAKEKKIEAKEKEKGPQVQTSTITFADVGGNEACLREVCQLLVHLRHPEVYQCLGVVPPSGFLLHGPPGCGKTLLANAIAGELQLPFIKLAATEVVSGVSGESEEKLREIFDKAAACAPSIIFIDEIDAITPKRETASKDMERRIVAQLLTCMDDLSTKASAHVLVIGATNRPDSLDPALRRAGRFDREICLGIPNEKGRKSILQVLCRSLKLETDFTFDNLAKMTPGYVGADLTALTRDAAMVAVNRVLNRLQSEVLKSTCDSRIIEDPSIENQPTTSDRVPTGAEQILSLSTPQSTLTLDQVLNWLKEKPPLTEEQLQDLHISLADFEEALKHIQPSAKREGFVTIPDVTWDDIGALYCVREELQMAIMAPIKHTEQFEELGLNRAQGILLAGPPGCGKTLLAKAIANESGINFISVKGPELLNMYVGESERAVRQVFQRARNSAPCVIFFDELDSLCPKRSEGGEGGASVRVVNQMLTEMDGLEERKQVFIMAATNRPDIIDPAILRPGRLDKVLYVGLPEAEDRLDIIRKITKNGSKPKFQKDLRMENVAMDKRCEGFSGADLTALVREASIAALKEVIKSLDTCTAVPEVTTQHFETAFSKVRPSVTQKDQMRYAKMKNQLPSASHDKV